MEEAEADYTLSEYKEAFVLVRVQIPNLKSKGRGLLKKITGGRRDQAKNAEIECDFQERSFNLTVTGGAERGMQNKRWTLSTANLPNPIDPFNSYFETEEGFVHVYLKKADLGHDWSSSVRKGELE